MFWFWSSSGSNLMLIKNNYKCSRTICVQYLKILFSSFGEEDFQRFALN